MNTTDVLRGLCAAALLAASSAGATETTPPAPPQPTANTTSEATPAAAGAPAAAPATQKPAEGPSLAERLDLVEVKQEDAVVKGDVPGSFRVPGTELSLRIYGWAELNYIHDFEGDTSDIDFSTFAPYVPLRGSSEARRTGRDILTARTSRFGIDGSYPTRHGALAAKVEGDFVNEPRTGGTEQYSTGGTGFRNVITQQQTSSYGFRLRHAYGTFAGFLVGQTWGTFMDVENSPETVDFNGPIGSTIIRQPMVRYTYATTSFGKLTAALENSSSYVIDPTDFLPMKSSLSRMPDLVLRWDRGFEWGSASIRGITQELRVRGPLNDDSAEVAASKRGYGAASTVFVKLRDNADFLSVGVTGGQGIGRYLNYIEGALYDRAANEIELERAVGAVAGYQLKLSPRVRVNLVYGITRNLTNDYTRAAQAIGFDAGRFGVNRTVQQAHVGPIFTPVPGIDLGVEAIWAQRRTLASERGDLARVNLMARYYIN